MKELGMNGGNQLEIMKNPFLSTCIQSISVSCYKGWDGTFIFYGKVGFMNGETKGEQEIKGESMDDVYLKVSQFVKSLNN